MEIITSLSNSKILEIIKLKDKKERLEKRLFICEGQHLVTEAFNHGLLISVFSSDEDILNKFDVDKKYLVTDAIIKKCTSTVNPQNVFGVVSMKEELNIDGLLKIDDLHVVLLDDVSDPGNMGTIIRTAAAFGYDAVIGSLNSVDYYNDKVIRSTQGSIFKITLIKTNLLEVIKKLKDNNVYIIGTSLQSSKPIDEIKISGKIGIVLGNEAHGMSEEITNNTTQNIILPMSNNVESLNVSVTSGIMMWTFKK